MFRLVKVNVSSLRLVRAGGYRLNVADGWVRGKARRSQAVMFHN